MSTDTDQNTDQTAFRLSTDKKVDWYKAGEELKIAPTAKRLLEEYSGIPTDELEKHIIGIVSA